MKSLKSKILSKKVMMSLLAAGVLSVGVAGSAFAEQIKNESKTILDKNITLSQIFTSDALNHEIVVGSDSTESVKINGVEYGVMVWGNYVYNTATNISINGNSIDISNDNVTRGAIEADYGAGRIDINGNIINIENKANKGIGILVANNSVKGITNGVMVDVISSVYINGNDEVNILTNNGNAIEAMSDGIVNIEGKSITLKGNKSIVARGDADVIINKSKTGTVKMDGDIIFEYNDFNSRSAIDANLDIYLTNKESYFHGCIGKASDVYPIPSGKSDVSHMHLTIENGAKWINTATSFVNELNMNNGGIVEFVNDKDEDIIEIDTLTGSGAIFNMKNSNTIRVGKFENDDVTLNSGMMKLVGGDTIIKGKLTLNKGANIEDSENGQPINLTLAAGSKLVIDDLNNYVEDGKPYPVIKIASGKVTAEKGASVSIGAAEEGTYTIVEAKEVVNNMSDEDVTFDGGLKTGTWINSDKEMNLKVAIKNLEEETQLVPTENAGLVEAALKNINKLNSNPNTQQLGDFFNKISQLAEQANTGSRDVTPPQVKAAIASSVQSGTNNGAASTAASVVNNVSSITNNRMSIVTPAPKGGSGVGLFAEESGAGVWAQYLHGKDKAEDLPSGSSKTQYKNSYNGILVGADFKKVDKFQSGIAFSYTDGDGSNSSTTGGTLGSTGHTDFKSYGVTYYGSIKNDTTNTMFDIGYNHSKADSDTNILLTGHTDSSTSKTNTWSAGVTVEKSYADGNNGAQFIPYVGVRYMNISTDDFTTKMGYHNAMDDQNVFLIPVGIKFRQENVYKNGWKVTPKADLSYVWATGDTDSNVNVTIPGMPSGASTIGYTVMDDGSFLGTVGVEAEKGNWTYGLSYSYQKGEYQRSDKWFVDVRYSF